MSELKSCPFCGRQPYESGGYVSCHTELCLANADYHEPAIGPITDWNTRPIEDALRARAERAEKMVERLIEVGERLRDYAILVSADHPMGDGQMALRDKSMWEYLVAECKESQLVTNAYKLKETK